MFIHLQAGLAVFGMALLSSAVSAQAPSQNSDLEVSAKKFFATLTTGKDARDQLSPEMASVLTPEVIDKLRSVPGIAAANWSYVSGLDKDSLRFAFFDLALQSQTLRMTYIVNESGKVAGFYVGKKNTAIVTGPNTIGKQSVAAIAADPSNFYGKPVSVSGVALQDKETASQAGSSYTTFQLCEKGCVLVYLHGHPGLNARDRVVVNGTFKETVQAGEYVFHNEIITSTESIHVL